MKLILIFIVNGEDVPVEVDDDSPIKDARDKALADSHNTGRPATEWEVRNEKGFLLDPNMPISDFNLVNGSKLFLTLQVGVGGHVGGSFNPLTCEITMDCSVEDLPPEMQALFLDVPPLQTYPVDEVKRWEAIPKEAAYASIQEYDTLLNEKG